MNEVISIIYNRLLRHKGIYWANMFELTEITNVPKTEYFHSFFLGYNENSSFPFKKLSWSSQLMLIHTDKDRVDGIE